MTPEQQRIAIAEACGWKRINEAIGPQWVNPHGFTAYSVDLPDYLNDLNAMHEAEKILPMREIELYGRRLRGFTDRADQVPYTRQWHATAAQRAEAFLKTLNLWME